MIEHGGRVIIEEISQEELSRKAKNAPNFLRLPPLDRYRVITIEDCEVIPCGGTHVRNISEIVGVKLVDVEQKEGSFRVYYDVQIL